MSHINGEHKLLPLHETSTEYSRNAANIHAMPQTFTRCRKAVSESQEVCSLSFRVQGKRRSFRCRFQPRQRSHFLLTGDARGDKILAGLRQVGLLDFEPMAVDILKVPHHGSDRNVEQDFFEQILANTYVFSGDGKHGNPERDTLD